MNVRSIEYSDKHTAIYEISGSHVKSLYVNRSVLLDPYHRRHLPSISIHPVRRIFHGLTSSPSDVTDPREQGQV